MGDIKRNRFQDWSRDHICSHLELMQCDKEPTNAGGIIKSCFGTLNDSIAPKSCLNPTLSSDEYFGRGISIGAFVVAAII